MILVYMQEFSGRQLLVKVVSNDAGDTCSEIFGHGDMQELIRAMGIGTGTKHAGD